MATLEQMQAALVAADKAGDTAAATTLAKAIQIARQDPKNMIPGFPVTGSAPPPPEPSLGEQAAALPGAALSVVTGATGGAIGMLAGAVKGLAEQILAGQFGTPEANRAVEQAAMQGAQALTYQPRTEVGQQQAAAVGHALQSLLPVVPLAGETAALSAGVRQAAPAIEAAVTPTIDRGAAALVGAGSRVAEMIPGRKPAQPTPGTMGSVGSAAIDAAEIRRTKAAELGFTGDRALTEGQSTRAFDATRFERETAKLPEVGAPLRERFTNQQNHFAHVLDDFIDQTEMRAPSLRGIGESVDSALRARAARDKTQIRTLYKEADKAGEMSAPVDLSPLAEYLNENRIGRDSVKILGVVDNALAVRELGAGTFKDGSLKIGEMTAKQAEELRKVVNKFTKQDDAAEVAVASEIKRIIDDSTASVAGPIYQKARAARARYARDYETFGLARDLLGMKRGTQDRAIALENVLQRSILDQSASLDTVRTLRKLLHTEGEAGKQAWSDLQGGTLQYIRDQTLSNVERNEAGSAVFSPKKFDTIITSMDRGGKLDFIFGKQGAEKLRVLNDVAKDILTVPAGTVNTSGTAAVIAGMLDMTAIGTGTLPVPVVSGLRLLARSVKDARTKSRVKKVLGDS